MPRTIRRTATVALVAAFLSPAAALLPASPASATTTGDVAGLALANAGKGAGWCSIVNSSNNSLGGNAFGSSCDNSSGTGNGEFWCADFAKWVWQHATGGTISTTGLTAAAGSFYLYGANNGTLHTASSYVPQTGDAVVYDYQGGGVADHVGLVTAVNSGGSIQTANGDFSGTSGVSQAYFAETSTVVMATLAASQRSVGSIPSNIGMTISAYVTPAGLTAVSHTIYHNIRSSTGLWQGWQPVAGYNGAATFAGSDESITGLPDGSSQMLGVAADGNVYHNIRGATGLWQGWQPVAGYNGAARFPGTRVAIAGMPNGTSQMLAVGTDGNVYHNIRGATGLWQGWQPVAGYGSNARFSGSGVAIAGMPDGSSQMLAVGTDGNVYHNIRGATGSWQGWQPVAGYGSNARFSGSGVAIAGMPDGSSQMLAVGTDGNVYHNIRGATGSWQGWQPVAGYGSNARFSGSGVAITGMPNGTSQMLAIGTDGNVYHNIRGATGSWQGWQPVAGYNGAARFPGTKVAIAGLPNGTSQMLATNN